MNSLNTSLLPQPERPASRKPKYATDFIPMTQYNKLIMGTG